MMRLWGFLFVWFGLALLPVIWPEFDLSAASAFFTSGVFAWRGAGLAEALHELVHPLSLALAAGLLGLALWTGWRGQGWRRWAFVLLTLVIGPGLVTNTLLKDNWGRARPVQVEQFGGTARFTPALVPANQCEKNCSFVCGDGAFGFWFHSFAYIAPRRRRVLFWSGLGIGAGYGLLRMGMGAHFFSDVVFAGLVIMAVSALLYRLMFGSRALAICWRDFLGLMPLSSAACPRA